MEALWREGVSATQIGVVLTREFNVVRSRNSVLSKVHQQRLATVARKGVTPPKRTGSRPRKRKLTPSIPHLPPRQKSGGKVFPPVLLSSPIPVEDAPPDAKLYTLANRPADGCTWFWGDPSKTATGYCGCPVVPGKAWCQAHLARVYTTAEVTRKPMPGCDEPAVSATPKLEPV